MFLFLEPDELSALLIFQERNERATIRHPNSDFLCGRDNGCAIDGIVLHRCQRLVCLIQGKYGDLGAKIYRGGDLKEVSSIGTSHIRDTPDLTLTPEQSIIVELGNAIEVNCVDGDHAAFAQARESGDDYISARSKCDRAVEFDWRFVHFVAYPCGSERTGQFSVRVPASRNIDLALPRSQNRNRQMRRGSEAK